MKYCFTCGRVREGRCFHGHHLKRLIIVLMAVSGVYVYSQIMILYGISTERDRGNCITVESQEGMKQALKIGVEMSGTNAKQLDFIKGKFEEEKSELIKNLDKCKGDFFFMQKRLIASSTKENEQSIDNVSAKGSESYQSAVKK